MLFTCLFLLTTSIAFQAVETRRGTVEDGVRVAPLPPGSMRGAGNSLNVFEAFKVYGGQIHAVEAFMKNMPAGNPSGWDDVYLPVKQAWRLLLKNLRFRAEAGARSLVISLQRSIAVGDRETHLIDQLGDARHFGE